MSEPSRLSATVHRRIEFSDVDVSGRYHYGTVIPLLEAAEVELLSELDLLDTIYTSMPRARLEVDYLATLRFMDEVAVKIEVESLGRTSVSFGFTIERGGEVAVRGKLVTVHVDGHGAPTPWSDEARRRFSGENE